LKKRPLSPNDTLRLQSRQSLRVLDTEPEERFDRFARLARKIFDVPIALVSLIEREREWFEAQYGIDIDVARGEPVDDASELAGEDLLVVNDVRADARFRANPIIAAAPNIRFYAGCPLRGPLGEHIGTFSLIDNEPREFTDHDVETLKEMAHMVEAEFSSTALATTDDLTGISNRRGFKAIATHALSAYEHAHRRATLVSFDLDGFKDINDDLGHEAGDRVLIDFARLLLKAFRDSAVVARLGGDEFCVLLTQSDPESLDRALDLLREGVSQRNAGLSWKHSLRYSAGVVEFDPDRHHDLDGLLRDADQRMYSTKRRRTEPGATV
jgi:diguanylate cyclase (GGDEF)-like protein